MPNLLLMISGACIVAFVLRETLEDLQKKTSDHDDMYPEFWTHEKLN